MIFRRRKGRILVEKDILINNTVISMVDKTKFLGVMIDEYLSFSPHIQYIKGKISRSLGILYKCKKFFKDSTLVMLYNAFIYPYFTYCVTGWGNTYSSYLDPFIKLQKKAIRLIIVYFPYNTYSWYNVNILTAYVNSITHSYFINGWTPEKQMNVT